MNVYLCGRDFIGWSLDQDFYYTRRFLKASGIRLTKYPWNAGILHLLCWNKLLSLSFIPVSIFFTPFKHKKILAVASNEINTKNHFFLRAKKNVDLWIAPSKRQYRALKESGVKVCYQPFYVNEKIFKRISLSKQKICEILGINYNIFKNRFVIGSFQRDSLGSDLSKPKWQKGPDILVKILRLLSEEVGKDSFLLLLAGPRRHFIIRECIKSDIPFYFYGDMPREGKDDIKENVHNLETMNSLYNLIDLYIVSSRSEGGPKSVIESAYTKTMILSTRVGLAPDILSQECLYHSIQDAVKKITYIIDHGRKFIDNLVERNYKKAVSTCSYDVMLERWKQIYTALEQ